MQYMLIRSKDNVKFYFRLIKPAEFSKLLSNKMTGHLSLLEMIAFLNDCETNGLIKIKSTNNIIIMDWESI